jgi:hypothetical protein
MTPDPSAWRRGCEQCDDDDGGFDDVHRDCRNPSVPLHRSGTGLKRTEQYAREYNTYRMQAAEQGHCYPSEAVPRGKILKQRVRNTADFDPTRQPRNSARDQQCSRAHTLAVDTPADLSCLRAQADGAQPKSPQRSGKDIPEDYSGHQGDHEPCM